MDKKTKEKKIYVKPDFTAEEVKSAVLQLTCNGRSRTSGRKSSMPCSILLS